MVPPRCCSQPMMKHLCPRPRRDGPAGRNAARKCTLIPYSSGASANARRQLGPAHPRDVRWRRTRRLAVRSASGPQERPASQRGSRAPPRRGRRRAGRRMRAVDTRPGRSDARRFTARSVRTPEHRDPAPRPARRSAEGESPPFGGRVNGTEAVADGGVERETPVAFHVAVLPQQPGIARTRAGACSYTGFACP